MTVKVWLGGEGTCELGGRADGQERVGVIEAMLLKLEPSGWRVEGARRWKHIRKYRAGLAVNRGENHGDIRNVVGLALEAWEEACELLAFTRDIDADEEREEALTIGIMQAVGLFPSLKIIGGSAKPAIEGWILALLGVPETDEMSRQRTVGELTARDIPDKNPEAYVDIVDDADIGNLPRGCESLSSWLRLGREILREAVHGTVPET